MLARASKKLPLFNYLMDCTILHGLGWGRAYASCSCIICFDPQLTEEGMCLSACLYVCAGHDGGKERVVA